MLYYVPGTHPFIEEVVEEVAVDKSSRHVEDDQIMVNKDDMINNTRERGSARLELYIGM